MVELKGWGGTENSMLILRFLQVCGSEGSGEFISNYTDYHQLVEIFYQHLFKNFFFNFELPLLLPIS